MKVAKITKDGNVYYTNDLEQLRKFPEDPVEFLEMTQEEYMAIPVTADSLRMFA